VSARSRRGKVDEEERGTMVRWWLEKSGRSRDELQEIGRMIWPEIAGEHPGSPCFDATLPCNNARPHQHERQGSMIGVAIALLLIGVVLLFLIPWVGIPVGIVGLVLVGLWMAGFGRRAMDQDQPAD
jgi:Flp pilus assembly protein TadB